MSKRDQVNKPAFSWSQRLLHRLASTAKMDIFLEKKKDLTSSLITHLTNHRMCKLAKEIVQVRGSIYSIDPQSHMKVDMSARNVFSASKSPFELVKKVGRLF